MAKRRFPPLPKEGLVCAQHRCERVIVIHENAGGKHRRWACPACFGPEPPPKAVPRAKFGAEQPGLREWYMCRAKRRYDSLTAATGAAVQYKQRVYECPQCGRWHLTKQRAG